MIQYTKALAWRLRVNLVCRQAARQFVKEAPSLNSNLRYFCDVSNELSDRANKLSEYIRLTYRADPQHVQQARQLFVSQVWQSINRGR